MGKSLRRTKERTKKTAEEGFLASHNGAVKGVPCLEVALKAPIEDNLILPAINQLSFNLEMKFCLLTVQNKLMYLYYVNERGENDCQFKLLRE